jgi:antitoxin MazE
MAIRTKLIRVGNSHGLRIPKSIRDQCGFGATVELTVVDGALVVRPVTEARTGWEEAFRDMHARSHDLLADWETAATSDWDETEWEW